MKGGAGKIKEEMKEAEEEIEEDDAADGIKLGVMAPLEDMEEGRCPGIVTEDGKAGESNARQSAERPACARKPRRSWAEGARNFCSLFLGPVFVQAFVLTFLGEWGDRSQIATIALGAAHVCIPFLAAGSSLVFNLIFLERVHRRSWDCDWTLVLYGAGGDWRPLCLHQDLCKTRFVSASMPRWSLVTVLHPVTYSGSILFLLFGLIYFHEAMSMKPDVVDMPIPISIDGQS
jgi:Ca2+/H+ antiporter, TMEM165/GDT1 family